MSNIIDQMMHEYQDLKGIDFNDMEDDDCYNLEGRQSEVYKILRSNHKKLDLDNDEYTEREVYGRTLKKIKNEILVRIEEIKQDILGLLDTFSRSDTYVSQIVPFQHSIGIESYIPKDGKGIIKLYGLDPLIPIINLNHDLINLSCKVERLKHKDVSYIIDAEVINILKKHIDENIDRYTRFYIVTKYPKMYYKHKLENNLSNIHTTSSSSPPFQTTDKN